MKFILSNINVDYLRDSIDILTVIICSYQKSLTLGMLKKKNKIVT